MNSPLKKRYRSNVHWDNTFDLQANRMERWANRVTYSVIFFSVIYFGGHILAWYLRGSPVGR